MTREQAEDFILGMWADMKLPEIETPEATGELLTIFIRMFPRLAEMQIEAARAWFMKSLEIKAVAKNKSDFDFLKKTCEEYYIYSLIAKNADMLSDLKTTLQSKLKNWQREYQDAATRF